MSFSKSNTMDGSKLFGYAGSISQTATGPRAVRIEYFPTVRGAAALGLWPDTIIQTTCAGLQTSTSKSVQTHGSVDVHAQRGTCHAS